MDLDRIKPLRGWVFLEAIFEERNQGGIILPVAAEERYPQSAWVRATGAGSELLPGDLAVIPSEGHVQDSTYWPSTYLVLFDSGRETKINCAVETFDQIRETVEGDRRSGEIHWLTLKTLDSETLRFTSDEVLDYGIEDLSHPGFRLDYTPTQMLWFWEGGIERLFYFTKEANIALVIQEW